MKHIALSILALAAGAAQAQSSVQLYGILDVGVTRIDGYGSSSRNFVSSGTQVGSRLGLKGTEEIAPGWKAMFTIEHQLYADTGSQNQQTPISGTALPARVLVDIPNTIRDQLVPQLGASLQASLNNRFWHRQAWVAAVTPAGAISLGRQYSPVFATFGRFDPHQAGNVGNAFATLTVPTGLEVRIDNAIQYVAETGGFRLNAMYAPDEKEVGNGRFWGISTGYQVGGFDFGIGHQRRQTSEGLDSLENTIVGLSYETGPFKLWGQWVRAKDKHPVLGAQLRATLNASTQIPAALKPAFLAYGSQIATALGFDGSLSYVGLHYKINAANKLVASYGMYDDKRAINADAAIAGLALEHIKSKRTSIWLSGSYVDNKEVQQILPYSQGLLYGFTDKPGRDSSALSINMVHRF